MGEGIRACLAKMGQQQSLGLAPSVQIKCGLFHLDCILHLKNKSMNA